MRVLPFVLSLLLVVLIGCIRPAAAAQFSDCAPVGTLDNFDASAAPDTRTWDALDFIIMDGKQEKRVTKYGGSCRQVYSLKRGLTSSNLEIMRNYAEGLPGLGFTITNTDRNPSDEVDATITRDGAEYWVRIYPSNASIINVNVLQVQPFKPSLALAGDKDCAPLVGLDRFAASDPPQTHNYAEESFRVIDGKQAKQVTKDGKTCRQVYSQKQGTSATTNLEIMKNYEVALPAEGFRITNTDRSETDEIDATRTKDGTETWVRVWPSNANVVSMEVLTVAPFQSTLAQLGPNDCPLVPTIANFAASSPPDTRTFAQETFHVVEGNAGKSVNKTGRTCRQVYSEKAGLPNAGGLEIMMNYAHGLPAEGFRIANTDRDPADEIDATRTQDGVETWVRVWPSNGNVVTVLVLQIEPFKPSLAPQGPNDCPLVPALVDFAASGPPQTKPYDSIQFHAVQDGKGTTVTKAGRTCHQTYGLKQGLPRKTNLEIAMNYAKGLPAAGFTIANTDRSDDDDVVATMTKDGTESWVRVWPSNGNTITAQVLQIAPFKSSLKAAQTIAAPIKTELVATATRGGQPLGAAWCGTFAPGKDDPNAPVSRANSGEVQELAKPDTYDVGCFIAEQGSISSGWLKAQTLSQGKTTLAIEIPARFKSIELTLAAPGATAETVQPNTGDFPYLGPIPGSTLLSGRATAEPFYVQPADAKQPDLVANGSIVKDYQSPPGVGLALLFGAYKTALLRAHWTIVSERHEAGVLIVTHYGENGRNIWASLHLMEHGYEIIVADATIAGNTLAADLGAKCHLALTGVLFDFDKSTLKPESDAVLTQVAALMAMDPRLNLEVQGHTDNVGTEGYNQTLSEARARSVVVWLTQHNVMRARLTARGYGKDRPIAGNDTDAGRARNRRVEIADPTCRKSG